MILSVRLFPTQKIITFQRIFLKKTEENGNLETQNVINRTKFSLFFLN
jgi:hypothetical protein